MQQKTEPAPAGGATFAILTLTTGAGLLTLLVGVGRAEQPVLSIPILAAVLGVLTAGLVLLGMAHE
jgi:hypothetical protein